MEKTLDDELPMRAQLACGVTEKLQIADGTEQGAMHPGRAYKLNRDDFIRLRLDVRRSHALMLLEPKVPSLYFLIQQALAFLYPNVPRQPFLSTHI